MKTSGVSVGLSRKVSLVQSLGGKLKYPNPDILPMTDQPAHALRQWPSEYWFGWFPPASSFLVFLHVLGVILLDTHLGALHSITGMSME